MSGFDFEETEPWEVSTDRWMPIGNHVAKIVYIEAEKPSSNGYPMVEVKTENRDGETARDWIVISPKSGLRKFKSLVLAAGVPEDQWPKPVEDYDPSTGAIRQPYAQKLLNRSVGVVVRGREDKPNQGEVKGYVLPAEVTDDLPADTRGLPQANASSRRGEKKIPF